MSKMFFLQAELAKGVRNEVLSQWMEPGTSYNNVSVSVFTFITWFSVCFLPNSARVSSHPPVLCQFSKKKKGLSYFDSSVSGSETFFYLKKILFVCCNIFVMVVIAVLLHCCVADKWHSVCENVHALNFHPEHLKWDCQNLQFTPPKRDKDYPCLIHKEAPQGLSNVQSRQELSEPKYTHNTHWEAWVHVSGQPHPWVSTHLDSLDVWATVNTC